jgi:RES domain-containing protein
MNVFRISYCKYIDDLSGKGAAIAGGRWNSEGIHVLYTASTASLAMLETLAHLKSMPVTDFCITCLEVPDEDLIKVAEDELPSSWNAYPAPVTLQKIGDRYLRTNQFLSVQLPSALLSEDKVILLNPNHPKFKRVKVVYTRKLAIDKRLYSRP